MNDCSASPRGLAQLQEEGHARSARSAPASRPRPGHRARGRRRSAAWVLLSARAVVLALLGRGARAGCRGRARARAGVPGRTPGSCCGCGGVARLASSLLPRASEDRRRRARARPRSDRAPWRRTGPAHGPRRRRRRSTRAADEPPSSAIECARSASSRDRPAASRSGMRDLPLQRLAARPARGHGRPVDVLRAGRPGTRPSSSGSRRSRRAPSSRWRAGWSGWAAGRRGARTAPGGCARRRSCRRARRAPSRARRRPCAFTSAIASSQEPHGCANAARKARGGWPPCGAQVLEVQLVQDRAVVRDRLAPAQLGVLAEGVVGRLAVGLRRSPSSISFSFLT